MKAHQALLSLGFSRQEHWSGLPFQLRLSKTDLWGLFVVVILDFFWLHFVQRYTCFVKKKIVMGNFLFSQGPVAVKTVLELSVYWKHSIIHWGHHDDLKLSCGVKSLAIFLISFMIVGCVNQCSPEKQNQLDIYINKNQTGEKVAGDNL